MSIRVNYKGNIGNSLFQYTYARLLALRNDLYLQTPFPYQKLLETTPHAEGKEYTMPKIVLEEPLIYQAPDSNISDPGDIGKVYDFYRLLDEKLTPGQYVLNGYFEYADLFNPYEELIRSFFKLNPAKKNTNDIVINIRLGDFADYGRIINSNWYMSILEKESFDKLYIVGAAPDEPYLSPFLKYNPIIVPSDPIADFHFIRSFDKIICSNSTYCWWAAFLSNASVIYISDKWISPILSSCKNSILIKADHMESYKTNFYYLPVQKLIQAEERIKLALDDHIAPADAQVRQFVKSNIELIYNSIKKERAIEPYSFQFNIEGVCRFSMSFYENGRWFSEGATLLADCNLNFADWTAFYEWLFSGLADIGDPLILIKGNVNTLASRFNLPLYEKEITNTFNAFKKNAPFVKYSKAGNVMEKMVSFLKKGLVVAWFEEQSSSSGQLYIWLIENASGGNLQVMANLKANKFCSVNETRLSEYTYISKGNELFKSVNILSNVYEKLYSEGLKAKIFLVAYKKDIRSKTMSFENALRLFNVLQADHLILNNYIVDKTSPAVIL